MTTEITPKDLDRLFEEFIAVVQARESIEIKFQSIKSQIESKLAQANFDKTMLQHHKIQSEKKEQELSQLREEIKNHECLELQCPLCDGDLIVDDCVEHCVYCNSSLKHKFVLEDKSLRPIVQALRGITKDDYSKTNVYKAWYEIKSILANNEVKQ